MAGRPQLSQQGGRLVVEGLPELRRTLRELGGRELERELGQVHRRIGEMVIQEAGGPSTGVGSGRGSTIRPSAALREVLLRVGGKHRAEPLPSGARRPVKVRQWGVTPTWPPPNRPYLVGAAVRIQPAIEDEYMAGIERLWNQGW